MSQAARAGTAEDEGQAAGFDQAVNLVEQAGNFLDFVDNHRMGQGFGSLPGEHFTEPRGSGAEGERLVRVEQVDVEAVWESLAQQRGLAGLPGAPEEGGLSRRQVDDQVSAVTHREEIPDWLN